MERTFVDKHGNKLAVHLCLCTDELIAFLKKRKCRTPLFVSGDGAWPTRYSQNLRHLVRHYAGFGTTSDVRPVQPSKPAKSERLKDKSATPRCGLCDWRKPWNGEQSLFHTSVLNWMYGSKVHIGPDDYCGDVCTVCEKELAKYLAPNGTGWRAAYNLTAAERGMLRRPLPQSVERLRGIVPGNMWTWPYDEPGINTWRQRVKNDQCTKADKDQAVANIQAISKARYDGPVIHERPKIGPEWIDFLDTHRRKTSTAFDFSGEGEFCEAGGGSSEAVDTKMGLNPFAGAFDQDDYYAAEDRGNRAQY